MNRICGRIFFIALFVSVLIILAGCNDNTQLDGKADAKESTAKAAWVAYWDVDAGDKDWKRLGKRLDKLLYFGAYFDKFDSLFIPQELSSKRSEQKRGKYETYLTFINDKQNYDGTLSLKDLDVLRRAFSNEEAMQRHIDTIIAMTLEGRYDGIEIDYEKIWKDEKIGQSFLNFINKLYAKCLDNRLKLRVVLEPSAPFSSPGLIKGPEYVVMLYNLYGLHSNPGPKANKDFIEKVITRMQALQGEKSVALSTGGCVWGDNGKKRFITEAEAETLAVIYDSKKKRDKDSQCLIFEYKDMGVTYQVWYADAETLNYWITIAKDQGINNISLWRLGGNVGIDKIK